MIYRENPNFVARTTQPNPREVSYWIDLTEGPDGQIIKSYVNNTWVKVNQNENEQQTVDIAQLRQDVNNLATTKADKATTLSGYGITDAYTKTEVDTELDNKANSSDVYTKSNVYTKDETDSAINTKVSALVNQAPETMDTLDELAAALGDDPNFATTVANQIGTKLDTSTYNSEKANFATKSEVNAKVSGTGITGIQVVSALPGSPTQNVLYIVTAA